MTQTVPVTETASEPRTDKKIVQVLVCAHLKGKDRTAAVEACKLGDVTVQFIEFDRAPELVFNGTRIGRHLKAVDGAHEVVLLAHVGCPDFSRQFRQFTDRTQQKIRRDGMARALINIGRRLHQDGGEPHLVSHLVSAGRIVDKKERVPRRHTRTMSCVIGTCSKH